MALPPNPILGDFTDRILWGDPSPVRGLMQVIPPDFNSRTRTANGGNMTSTPTPAAYTPDTLAAWWDAAEEGPVRKGDTYIWHDEGYYSIREAPNDHLPSHSRRVLKRARQPWQDAPAVMAHTAGDSERRAFIYSIDDEAWWDNSDYGTYAPSDLINPVPMIEARVTDYMAAAGNRAYIQHIGGSVEDMKRAIDAAIREAANLPA